jgi:hypothetical protein
MCPNPITTTKPGLFPDNYTIPEGSLDEFSTFVVSDSYYMVPLPMSGGRSIKRPVPAEELGQAIVNDYVRSLIGYSHNIRPCLFVVPDEPTREEIIKNHAEELAEGRLKQLAWYGKLIETADEDWNKHRSHRSITQIQKKAAAALGLKREWIMALESKTEVDQVDCLFCFSKIHPQATICPVCRTSVATPEKAKK